MLDQIHRNYTQRLTLATVARTLGRQSAYLGRLFRDEIGVTVHEYVTRARMIFGAAQVRSGVKIEAVALDLGYRSKKNFYRQFKRRFGMTPEAYRHEHDPVGNGPVPLQRPSRRNQTARPRDVPVVKGTNRLASGQSRGKDRAPWSTSLAQRIMRALVRQGIAMLATDDTGCCVAANEAAVSVSGYSVDELRGMPAAALFPNGSGCNTACRLQLFLPASASLPANAMLHAKSTSRVEVHLTSVANVLGRRERLRPPHSPEHAPVAPVGVTA
jgi:AraC-like DNA-binding protein